MIPNMKVDFVWQPINALFSSQSSTVSGVDFTNTSSAFDSSVNTACDEISMIHAHLIFRRKKSGSYHIVLRAAMERHETK